MSRQSYRVLVLAATLAALSGCATSRIEKCEEHLVPINPPPKATAAPVPKRKSLVLRSSGRRP